MMRVLWLLLLVGACALPASHLTTDVAPSEPRHGGEGLVAVLIGAVFAFVVIPGVVGWHHPAVTVRY